MTQRKAIWGSFTRTVNLLRMAEPHKYSAVVVRLATYKTKYIEQKKKSVSIIFHMVVIYILIKSVSSHTTET